MALTDHCDIFASLSEDAINAVVRNVARQRPSMFNYGTASFVANPSLLCSPLDLAPNLPGNQPLLTLENPIPVPGTDGAWGLEYCAQLTRLQIDFHPGQLIQLPPELQPPLNDQRLALQARACGAIACPSSRLIDALGDKEADRYRPIDPAASLRGREKRQEPPQRPPMPLPADRENIHCFCLDVFAIAHLRRDQTVNGPALAIELEGLEIVDIEPDGLEDSIECLISATIRLGVLPRLRLSIQDLILSLGTYGSLTIGLTPTSAQVPFNPSIAKDELSVFVSVS